MQKASSLIEWLLEPDADHAGVRFFTLRDLCGLPESDPQVAAARREGMTTGPIPAILSQQKSCGGWEEPGEQAYQKYHGSHWQLHILACLGADPQDDQVKRAGNYALEAFPAANQAFAVYQPPRPSEAIICLNGNLVDALIGLGFAHDARLQAAAGWIAHAVTGEEPIQYYRSSTPGPGFACMANAAGLPCGWGAVKAVRALTSLPTGLHTPVITRALQAGAEFLLSRDPAVADYPYTERVSSTWFKLGFPLSYWSDVLELVDVLARLGYGQDARLDGAWELILNKRGSDGRWTLENNLNGKMWVDIDQKGKPSKWITLRALTAFKRAGRLADI